MDALSSAEWEERPLGEPQAQSMAQHESLERWECDSSPAPALGSSQGHAHTLCQAFPHRPPPVRSLRWNIWELSIFSGNPITEKRWFLPDSGRPRDWGAVMEVSAEQRGPYRKKWQQHCLPLDCNSPDLSSSSSSSKAAMSGCLMFSGAVDV